MSFVVSHLHQFVVLCHIELRKTCTISHREARFWYDLLTEAGVSLSNTHLRGECFGCRSMAPCLSRSLSVRNLKGVFECILTSTG